MNETDAGFGDVVPTQEGRPKRIAIALTVVVVLVFFESIFSYFGLLDYIGFVPNTFGDTIAGFGTILAFVWLVAGYVLQQKELRLNTIAIGRQARELAASVSQLEQQSISLRETQLFTKRDVSLKLIEKKEKEIIKSAVWFVRDSNKYGNYIEKQHQKFGDSLEDTCLYIFVRKIFHEEEPRSWVQGQMDNRELKVIIRAFHDAQKFARDMNDDGKILHAFENGISGDVYKECCRFLALKLQFEQRKDYYAD